MSDSKQHTHSMHAWWHGVAVAPMMGWTDRHCRFFHACLAPTAVLYSEMVTANAIRFGGGATPARLLSHHKPSPSGKVILQLGGCEPEALAAAVRIAENEGYGYHGYNLNAGCPSPRVQNGRFGACLMEEPSLVKELVEAMRNAAPSNKPISVKCRIGVDDMHPVAGLDKFADWVLAGRADYLVVHARKAILGGLNPKQNRTIPPLDYQRVYALKQRLGDYPIVINGGLTELDDMATALAHVDGVMLGRVAYQQPRRLWQAAATLTGTQPPPLAQVIARMVHYASDEIAHGTPLIAISRHMLGLANGWRGARAWRRELSEVARTHPQDTHLISRAWSRLMDANHHYARAA